MSGEKVVDQVYVDLIEYPNEERHIEFKRSVRWDGDIRAKITKSIMAMSNLRDGGWIVVGKEEQPDRSFSPVGMSQADFDSFDPDEVQAFVYARAEPPVDFDVRKIVYNGKKFVIIRVKEFENEPVICKKSYGNILHNGVIYIRSKGKPESIPVPSQYEMREIIENAIDKGVRAFFQRSQRIGIMRLPSVDDAAKFSKQVEELL